MKNLKNKGWVRIWRKIEDNPIWFLEPFTKAQAWVDLFLNANHKDGFIDIRGNIVTIERGQIGWSELTMAKRWKWSKNKVRRYLKWLETIQQIVQQKDRYLTTIITILQYEDHQNDTADDTAERQQTIHKQELKNDNNGRSIHVSQAKRVNKCTNKNEGHKGCIEFIDSLAEEWGGKFPNYARQINGLHKLLGADYTFNDINKKIDEMEKDHFWSSKGFDLMNIVNEMGKGGYRG